MADLGRTLRQCHAPVLGSVLGTTRDLQQAEDAVQHAIVRALETWPERGVPDEPEAWLVRVALNAHLDDMRRQTRQTKRAPDLLEACFGWTSALLPGPSAMNWKDELLQLIFTCCDPVLSVSDRAALALNTLAGLSTEQVSRAFLVAPRTMEQRLTRARRRLRGRSYRPASPADAPERLESVLGVVYFIFNEGMWACGQTSPIRRDLTGLALSLARSLDDLLPGTPQVLGLLALLLFHEARLPARLDEHGNALTLEEQDRSQWNSDLIEEGRRTLDRALRAGAAGPYAIEAAIAATHCSARRAEDTDWTEVACLYALLEEQRPSAVVRLNRAFAVGQARGPEAGLEVLASVEAHPSLQSYVYLHLVRGVLLGACGRSAEAADSFRRAETLASNPVEAKQIRARWHRLVSPSAAAPTPTRRRPSTR